jgi:hypothetical protein
MILAFHFGHICLVFIGTAVVGGCRGEQAQQTSGLISRDSAGMAIIESAAPQWSQGEGWRIEPEPILRIGTVDGPDEWAFVMAPQGIPNSLRVRLWGSADPRLFQPSGYRQAAAWLSRARC